MLDKKPPYDVLPVQVELSEIGQASLGLVERVETAIKTKLGASAKITILASKSLPVTEGKTKRVMRTYK